jgi:hypothetical protein
MARDRGLPGPHSPPPWRLMALPSSGKQSTRNSRAPPKWPISYGLRVLWLSSTTAAGGGSSLPPRRPRGPARPQPAPALAGREPAWWPEPGGRRRDGGESRGPFRMRTNLSGAAGGADLRPAAHLDMARRQAGAAGVPAAPACLARELADDDACGRGAGGQRERGGTQLGQAAAVDGERGDRVGLGLIDIQEAAVRAQPGVDRAGIGPAGRRAGRQQGQRAVGGDLVGGDRPDAVFTVNRNWPSWVISTQHGAIWWSGNGEPPIEDSLPFRWSLNAETVPLSVAVLWALDTKS